jgi:hypothetical protein
MHEVAILPGATPPRLAPAGKTSFAREIVPRTALLEPSTIGIASTRARPFFRQLAGAVTPLMPSTPRRR